MLRKVLGAVALALLVAGPAWSQTADDIIEKNATAKGGVARMKAITTMRSSGRVTVGPGVEAPIRFERRRPTSVRVEVVLQGLTIIQAYDGKVGWILNPMRGRNDPEPMPSEMLKSLEEQADFDGPLVDYKMKGTTAELLGREKAEGAECYKVKLTLKNGDTRIYYIEAEKYLEVKVESKTTIRGTAIDSDTLVGDWRDVSGVMMPFSLDGGQKGAPARQKITLEKIEVNPAIDDARFRMPEIKK